MKHKIVSVVVPAPPLEYMLTFTEREAELLCQFAGQICSSGCSGDTVSGVISNIYSALRQMKVDPARDVSDVILGSSLYGRVTLQLR